MIAAFRAYLEGWLILLGGVWWVVKRWPGAGHVLYAAALVGAGWVAGWQMANWEGAK